MWRRSRSPTVQFAMLGAPRPRAWMSAIQACSAGALSGSEAEVGNVRALLGRCGVALANETERPRPKGVPRRTPGNAWDLAGLGALWHVFDAGLLRRCTVHSGVSLWRES